MGRRTISPSILRSFNETIYAYPRQSHHIHMDTGVGYQVIGVAVHTTTMEPLVIYSEPNKYEILWARPAKEFGEKFVSVGHKTKKD